MLRQDILMIVLSVSEDEPVIAAAKILQDSGTAAASALLFPQTAQVNEWVVAADGAFWADPLLAISQRAPDSVRLKRRMACFAHPPQIKQIGFVDGASADWAGTEARGASLTIMLRPTGATNESFRRAIFESALFESGRPVLLIPPTWKGGRIGARILIAWDGSREAARAVADAAPLLAKAEQIYLFTVDAGSCGLPGHEAAKHLRRMGLRCQQRTARGARSDIDAMILREHEALGADLIVMGGYGHARFHERLFGGVTRALLRATPTPLLISR